MDVHLPFESRERPLRHLFLDLNSYFASVEQQDRPELRGKPVAVAPMLADTTVAIAASYEAKKFGVKCGVTVRDAKAMCPELILVDARPTLYVAYHEKIKAVLETILPIAEVCSIDEMRFELMGEEMDLDTAKSFAVRMKKRLLERMGECMTCSVGVATNRFLAKVATEMQKPDGLIVLQTKDLPHKLHSLKLTDFTGVNRRIQARLNAAGIFSVEQLCAASKLELRNAFGSITGERYWYLLRGHDLPHEVRDKQTLSHSHVLSPQRRTEEGCREVLLRLIQKATARLRVENLWTTSMMVFVHGFERSWECRIKLPPTQDSVTVTEWFISEWPKADYIRPRSVGVVFTELHKPSEVTPSLFDNTLDRALFNHAVDDVNQRFGKNKIYLAALDKAKDSATEKIAFNKTWLFQEGRGDNDWAGLAGEDG